MRRRLEDYLDDPVHRVLDIELEILSAEAAAELDVVVAELETGRELGDLSKFYPSCGISVPARRRSVNVVRDAAGLLPWEWATPEVPYP